MEEKIYGAEFCRIKSYLDYAEIAEPKRGCIKAKVYRDKERRFAVEAMVEHNKREYTSYSYGPDGTRDMEYWNTRLAMYNDKDLKLDDEAENNRSSLYRRLGVNVSGLAYEEYNVKRVEAIEQLQIRSLELAYNVGCNEASFDLCNVYSGRDQKESVEQLIFWIREAMQCDSSISTEMILSQLCRSYLLHNVLINDEIRLMLCNEIDSIVLQNIDAKRLCYWPNLVAGDWKIIIRDCVGESILLVVCSAAAESTTPRKELKILHNMKSRLLRERNEATMLPSDLIDLVTGYLPWFRLVEAKAQKPRPRKPKLLNGAECNSRAIRRQPARVAKLTKRVKLN